MLPFEKKRKLTIKIDDVGKLGVNPYERPVEQHLKYGIINLDKPSGPTSHQVTFWARELLGLNKVGHGGTLDPRVTGILPILIEKSTKVEKIIQKSGKEYVTLMHVHCNISEDKLRDTIMSFVGEINQLPPVKSSVKRRFRKRRVYYIEILEIRERDVLFKVGVEGGTYIRKLCHDIGKKLGCGAHMAELRRTKAGGLTEEDHLVTLQDISDAVSFYKEDGNDKFLRYVVQPIEKFIFVPKVYVFDDVIPHLLHGSPVFVPGVSKFEDFDKGDDVAIMSLKGELIALGKAMLSPDEILHKEKGLAIKTDAVIKDIGDV